MDAAEKIGKRSRKESSNKFENGDSNSFLRSDITPSETSKTTKTKKRDAKEGKLTNHY